MTTGNITGAITGGAAAGGGTTSFLTGDDSSTVLIEGSIGDSSLDLQNVVIGVSANVSAAKNTVVIGWDSRAEASGCVVIGASARASGYSAVVIGHQSYSTGLNNVIIGANITPGTQSQNTIIGQNAGTGTGAGCVIIGQASSVGSGNSSVVIGNNAFVSGAANTGVVIGVQAAITTATQSNSVVLGYQTNASASSQVTFGDRVLRLGAYTAGTLPTAATYTGHMIYVSDGAGGNPAVAYSDGTNWLRMDTNTTVTTATVGTAAQYEKIATYTTAAGANLDVTLPSGYSKYIIEGHFIPTTSGVDLTLQVTTNAFTSVVDTSAYGWNDMRTFTGSDTATGDGSDTFAQLATNLGVASGNDWVGKIEVIGAKDASVHTEMFTRHGRINGSGTYNTGYGGARYLAATSVDGIRFFTGALIANASVDVYGVK